MKRMDLRMSWHCKLPRILPHVILANAIIPRKCNKIDGCTHTQSISKHTQPKQEDRRAGRKSREKHQVTVSCRCCVSKTSGQRIIKRLLRNRWAVVYRNHGTQLCVSGFVYTCIQDWSVSHTHTHARRVPNPTRYWPQWWNGPTGYHFRTADPKVLFHHRLITPWLTVSSLHLFHLTGSK